MIISEKAKSNSAFYYEVCMLKILSAMGYLNEKDLNGIIKIASEDYGASLILDKTLLCLN
jgi:hypothetical protein